MAILTELNQILRTGIRRYRVPGASLAVLRGKRVYTGAAGVINLDTGVRATPDAVFQIGSITKTLTATLIMQLVDEGLLELDAPITTYLPAFRVARLDVSRMVTARHFLSHTSGIEGDLFADSGRGDDAVARLMDQARTLPSLFEPGEMMSYCNFGFATLGRIIETLRNRSYDQALIDYLFTPLGMTHAFSRPEDALRFRAAVGHLPDRSKKGKTQLRVAPVSYLSFGQKAAGSTPSTSAPDLLKFARLHLDRGVSADGSRVLSAGSVRAMQKRQIQLPRHMNNAIQGWGLGWFLINWDGTRLFGHDGATIGQNAYLRVLPEKKMAVALLTNGGDVQGLYRHVMAEVYGALEGIGDPEPPAPATVQPDPGPYAGTFENLTGRITLTTRRGELTATAVDKDTGDLVYPKATRLRFADHNTARISSGDPILDRGSVLFSQFNQAGQPGFLQLGLRQFRRTG